MKAKDIHTTAIQIRFNDLDIMGHVNNAVYQHYFDLAKMDYFNSVLKTEVKWRESGLLLARIQIDYNSPILISENLQIRTRAVRLGEKSMELEQHIINSSTQEIKAVGVSTMVAYSMQNQNSIIIPDAWRKKISHFEGIAMQSASASE